MDKLRVQLYQAGYQLLSESGIYGNKDSPAEGTYEREYNGRSSGFLSPIRTFMLKICLACWDASSYS